jgi:3-oxoacyl-[acyl-carrier-protein] synthase II
VSASRPVLITGVGLVTPFGTDPARVWARVRTGSSGITTLDDDPEVPSRIGAKVRGFDPEPLIEPRESRLMDPTTRFGVHAALAAVRDAGLVLGDNVAADRIGAIVGSGLGGGQTFEQQAVALDRKGTVGVSPYTLPMVLPNMIAARVAIALGCTGPTFGVVSACATGANAIGTGMRMIERGEADVMICGGAEAPLFPLCVSAFAALRALSRRTAEPAAASRPFDAGRDGLVLGEGAGVIVLESAAHARARGAPGFAAVVGYGTNTDAHHVTKPEPSGRGAAACIRRALADAELAPGDIGYINAHATSTKLGDLGEARAIRAVFGDDDQPPCSASKSMTGHLLGASAALEAVITAYAIVHDELPPTANLDDPDPACAVNHIGGGPITRRTRFAISNAFGFGGHNATLVLGKP